MVNSGYEDSGLTVFTVPPQDESLFLRGMKDLGAGWVGGIAQVLVGQPFDTIKVRMQTQPTIVNGMAGQMMYKSPADCFMKTCQQEGIKGFYKGTLMPLIGVGFCVSIQFAAMEGMKRFFASFHKDTPSSHGNIITKYQLTPIEFFISGSVAGIANTIVSGPVEHIRIRCQAAKSLKPPANFTGPIDCLRQIYKTQGIKGVYKGQVATFLRDSMGFGAYFLSYEYLIQRLVIFERSNGSNSVYARENIEPWKLVMFGGLAGLAFWIPVFPIDVIKSKMQTDSFSAEHRQYNSVADCVRKVYKTDGINGFFRGFTPCFLRAFPVNAATFVAFELAMRGLEKL